MNNDELIAAGHELAKCLDSNTPLLDIAKLLSKMATQLDVTTAALREKTKQCDELALKLNDVVMVRDATRLYLRGFPDSSQGRDIPLYTAPPAPVVPKIDRKAICNKAHWLCARSPGATFYNAAEFALDEVMEMLVTPATVVPDKCGCWYLVSWCYPGGRYGSTEIRLDGPWSTGSMRSAAKMIADYNDLVRANVVILSVFPIAAAPGKN